MEHATKEEMDSSKAALNATLGTVQGSYVYDSWQVQRSCSPGIQQSAGGDNICWFWLLWLLWEQQVENCGMATNSLTSGDQHRGECHCSHCVDELGLEDKGKSVEEE